MTGSLWKTTNKYLFLLFARKRPHRSPLLSKETSTLLVIAQREQSSETEARITTDDTSVARGKSSSRILFAAKRSNQSDSRPPEFSLSSTSRRNRNVCEENFRETSLRLLSPNLSNGLVYRCFRFVSILHPSWNLELISGRNSIRFEGVRELFIGAIGSPFVTNRAAARGLTLQLAMFRGKRGIDGAITWNGHTVVVWASFDFASCKSWKSRPFAAINWEFRFLPVRNKNCCWFIDSSFDLVHRRANVGDSSGICEFFLASESEQMILCRVVQFNSIGAFLISDRVGKKRIENKYYRFEIL